LIDEVVNAARAAVPGATIEISGTPIVLKADPEMTRAVLLNLLLNACQASPATPVEIRTSSTNGHPTIEVLDRGPGLPAEVREQLFQPFVTTRASGTGLGLAIAKRLTQVQGASLSLTDRAGGGTVARIEWPADEAPAPQAVS
jgi:signal transduction histidine kinase